MTAALTTGAISGSEAKKSRGPAGRSCTWSRRVQDRGRARRGNLHRRCAESLTETAEGRKLTLGCWFKTLLLLFFKLTLNLSLRG